MEKNIIRCDSRGLEKKYAAHAEDNTTEGDEKLPAEELIQYWCTVAVGEELHFTRAAQRLNLDQSAVSRHIQELEARLGFKLFVRGARGVELTDTGKSFLSYARKALVCAGQGETLAQAIARGDPQDLQVAYSPLVDLHLIAQMRGLADGGRLRLPVRFESVAPDRLTQRLYAGASHVAIGILPVEDNLAHVCILREKLFVALRSSHRLAERRAVSASQLGDDPLIWMFGSRGSLVSEHLMSLIGRAGYLPKIARKAQSASEALVPNDPGKLPEYDENIAARNRLSKSLRLRATPGTSISRSTSDSAGTGSCTTFRVHRIR